MLWMQATELQTVGRLVEGDVPHLVLCSLQAVQSPMGLWGQLERSCTGNSLCTCRSEDVSQPASMMHLMDRKGAWLS